MSGVRGCVHMTSLVNFDAMSSGWDRKPVVGHFQARCGRLCPHRRQLGCTMLCDAPLGAEPRAMTTDHVDGHPISGRGTDHDRRDPAPQPEKPVVRLARVRTIWPKWPPMHAARPPCTPRRSVDGRPRATVRSATRAGRRLRSCRRSEGLQHAIAPGRCVG